MGEGIRASGIPRSEIFVRPCFIIFPKNSLFDKFDSICQITSKVWGTFHENRVEECLDQSLANLGTDYLDRKLIGDSEAKN